MAQKTYTLNLDVNSASLGDLEKELEQINAELKQVGQNDKEFAALAASAQKVTAKIKETNTAIEGMTMEKKLEKADGAIKLFAGSLQTAIGTLGILGVESEAFSKFEEKAASAIAVGMGLKDMTEGFGKVFPKTMAKAVTSVQTFAKGTSKALIATGVGAFVVVLGAIIANWDAIVKGVEKVIASSEGLTNFFNSVKRGFKAIFESIRPVLEFFDLYPTLEEEMTQKAKENSEQRIKDIDNELKVRKASGEDTVDLEREKLTKLRDLQEKGTQEYKDAQANLDAFEKGLIKEKTDRDNAEAQRKIDQAKTNNEAYLALQKTINDEELALAAKTEEDKLKLAYDNQIKEIDNLKVSEDKKTQLKLEALANYNTKKNEVLDQQAITDAAKEEERRLANEDTALALKQEEAVTIQEERDAEIAATTLQYDRLIAAAKKKGEDTVALEKIKAAKIDKINKKAAEAQQADDEAVAANKEAGMNQAVDAVQGALSSLFGESKAVASANVLVDAGQAAVGIIKSSTAIPAPFNIPFQVAQFAMLAATTTASLKQINTAQPGGGGSGAGRRGATPQAPMGPTNTNAVNIQNIDEIQTQTTTPAVKAYVISGEVRNGTEADAKLAARRTLD